jgi:hypothetical protein
MRARCPLRTSTGDGISDAAISGVEFEPLIAMSKHNNVNPGQYKVGGRLHPGDDSSRQEHDKAQAAMTEQRLREEARGPEQEKE